VLKLTRFVLLLIILVAAAGTGRWIVHARHSYELSSRVFGGREAFDAFMSASEVTAERLHCNSPDGSVDLADYRRDSPTPLSSAQVSELKHLFTQRDSYSPQLRLPGPDSGFSIKTCGPPFYGVLLTFRSTPLVQMALCFRCDQFGIFVGDGTRYVNRDDALDFMRPSLIDLVKSIYPNDSQIQSLTRER
jgi:hypothetical protein